jgi:ATP-binding cassette subfamily B protein
MIDIKKKYNRIISTLKITFKSIPLLWKCAPFSSTLLVVILLIQGTVPLGTIWIIKLIINQITLGITNKLILVSVTNLVILWGLILLVESSITPVVSFLIGNLNEKFTAYINIELMQKANEIHDLYPFENAQIYNDIEILKSQAGSRPINFVVICSGMLKDTISLTGMFVLLGTLNWWIPFLMLLTTLPYSFVVIRLQADAWSSLLSGSVESRKMTYFSFLALTNLYAKEIRLFNFSNFLIKKFTESFLKLHTTMKKVRVKKLSLIYPVILLAISGNTFVFWWIVKSTLKGSIKIGSIVLLIQALSQSLYYLVGLLENFGYLYDKILFFDKFLIFMQYKSPFHQKIFLPVPEQFESLYFQNVSFKYNDRDLVLNGFNLKIKKGEKIAIVGENGSGKTTLVKLIMKFYEPTEGNIFVNDINLKNICPIKWREYLSAVFQDFGKYHLTIGENINIGNGIKGKNDLSIINAAKKINIHDWIQNMPNEYNTQLGKEFDGTNLSEGQWQKIALARSIIKKSSIIILDEPTASLDPKSEYEIFSKFSDLTEGKTALMITHRLGSIQKANRIIVIEKGKIIEDGTHNDLIKINGSYANLYNIQKSLYEF